MGYSIFKFGSLYLEGAIKNIPQNPTGRGDISSYKIVPHMHPNKPQMSIGSTSVADKKVISWVKPDGMNLLVADRVLVVDVSWQELNELGFVAGKKIIIDGYTFFCRLLEVGESREALNEWDDILTATSERDSLWHWQNIYFWGKESNFSQNAAHAQPNWPDRACIRGNHVARYWHSCAKTIRLPDIGFRPVLEILPNLNVAPNCMLDGQNFRLDIIPGGNRFHPVLYPVQDNGFKDIPNGQKQRMYTFVQDGQPVLLTDLSKNTTRLRLTDKYFGDEYLVPWTISNGVAVIDSTRLQQE